MLACSAGAQAKADKKTPKMVAREIDLATVQLDPKNIGLEVDDLLRALKPPKKDEFESTDAFVARQEAYAKTKFLGDLTPGGLIAVAAEAGTFGLPKTHYLADAGVQVVEPGPSPLLLWASGRQWPWVPLESIHKNVATYDKRNAYGTVIEVDKVKITIKGLAFTDASIKLLRGESGPNYQIKIEPAVARGLKGNLGVLYIGRLAPPFLVESELNETATWSSPSDRDITKRAAVMDVQELWIVNTKTGRVLHKAKSPLMTPEVPVDPIP